MVFFSQLRLADLCAPLNTIINSKVSNIGYARSVCDKFLVCMARGLVERLALWSLCECGLWPSALLPRYAVHRLLEDAILCPWPWKLTPWPWPSSPWLWVRSLHLNLCPLPYLHTPIPTKLIYVNCSVQTDKYQFVLCSTKYKVILVLCP